MLTSGFIRAIRSKVPTQTGSHNHLVPVETIMHPKFRPYEPCTGKKRHNGSEVRKTSGTVRVVPE
jgi:hypothetical protein